MQAPFHSQGRVLAFFPREGRDCAPVPIPRPSLQVTEPPLSGGTQGVGNHTAPSPSLGRAVRPSVVQQDASGGSGARFFHLCLPPATGDGGLAAEGEPILGYPNARNTRGLTEPYQGRGLGPRGHCPSSAGPHPDCM